MKQYFSIYLMIINGISFVLMFLDKRKAIKKKRRIQEQIFFKLTLVGGFLGVVLGGFLFNHKMSKRSFQIKILLSFLLFIVLVYLFDAYLIQVL